ncbi:MAG: RhuM family protein [Ferrovibrio sp.]
MPDIAIYQHQDGAIDVRLERETVWLSLMQMSSLLARDKSVISRHLRNVFAEGELERKAVVAKFAITADDGKSYRVDHYNLDVIISIGYGVKSPEGVRFRKWASRMPIYDIGLAALSLMVAESKPADKEVLIRLIMNMLAGESA